MVMTMVGYIMWRGPSDIVGTGTQQPLQNVVTVWILGNTVWIVQYCLFPWFILDSCLFIERCGSRRYGRHLDTAKRREQRTQTTYTMMLTITLRWTFELVNIMSTWETGVVVVCTEESCFYNKLFHMFHHVSLSIIDPFNFPKSPLQSITIPCVAPQLLYFAMCRPLNGLLFSAKN